MLLVTNWVKASETQPTFDFPLPAETLSCPDFQAFFYQLNQRHQAVKMGDIYWFPEASAYRSFLAVHGAHVE